MADRKKARVQNVAGDFFVDETCIDCDTCRWMAPGVFREAEGKEAVYHQPQSDEEKLKAAQALVACPTASIGSGEKEVVRLAVASFPIKIDGNVYFSGYTSEDSFGASSYFILRKGGNILVDSPRFAAPLVRKLEALGGVRYLFLTHRDDVADHKDFRRHFSCERILHEDDLTPSTRDIEIRIRGGEPHPLSEDALIIPVPGHTRGHTVMLYGEKFLFTGDHLAYSHHLNQLYAFRSACWYSWEELVRSMEKLARYDFEWVLPGHGRRFNAPKERMRDEMARCLAWMRGNSEAG